MMWHFHATQSIELSLTVESCSEQRHCTAIVTLQHFMVWSLFSRLSADLAHSACFSQDQSASSLGRWYKTVLGPNRRMQLSQLNAWYSVNTTSRPQPPSSWTLFSPCTHPSSPPPDTLTQGNFRTSPQSGKGAVFVRTSSNIFFFKLELTREVERWRATKQNWSWSTNIWWVSRHSSTLADNWAEKVAENFSVRRRLARNVMFAV